MNSVIALLFGFLQKQMCQTWGIYLSKKAWNSLSLIYTAVLNSLVWHLSLGFSVDWDNMSVCGKGGSWATSAVGTELTPHPSHCSSSMMFRGLNYKCHFSVTFSQFICFLKALCTDPSSNLWGNSLRGRENESCTTVRCSQNQCFTAFSGT